MLAATLMKYDFWANRQSLDALREGSYVVAAFRIAAHIFAIQDLWLSRIEGRDGSLGPWPEMSLDDIEASLVAQATRWQEKCDTLGSEVRISYTSSAGRICENTLDEIIHEVCFHNAHHRGQIALLLRSNASLPPRSTDLIPALRDSRF